MTNKLEISREFKAGSTDPVGGCGKFEASIDVGSWGARIAVYGDTAEDAEQLRSEVLAKLAAPVVERQDPEMVSVERELLVIANVCVIRTHDLLVQQMKVTDHKEEYRAEVARLKDAHEQLKGALLTAIPVPPLIKTLHANGDRIAMEATIAQQAKWIADLERVRDEHVAAVRGRGEPTGWRLVPAEPTDDMIKAGIDTPVANTGDDEIDQPQDYRNVYKAMINAVAEQPAPVASENLRNFANAMIDIALEGCDADGGHIQELAIKHGLLKPEQRTERCSDACSCAEYADFPVECFRKVKELNQ